MKANQSTLMDLWNNSVGITLAADSDLKNLNYDDLFYYAKDNNLIITDVKSVYAFYGIEEYINTSDWTVNIKFNIGDNSIMVVKEGLLDILLEVGINSWW